MVLNVKENTVDSALALVEIEIERRLQFGGGVFKVLHGHGSHGVGGVIRVELRKRLKELQKKLNFKYIPGEEFTPLKLQELQLKEEHLSELLVDEDYCHINPGITFVIVK